MYQIYLSVKFEEWPSSKRLFLVNSFNYLGNFHRNFGKLFWDEIVQEMEKKKTSLESWLNDDGTCRNNYKYAKLNIFIHKVTKLSTYLCYCHG